MMTHDDDDDVKNIMKITSPMLNAEDITKKKVNKIWLIPIRIRTTPNGEDKYMQLM
jgi:hypothetical protein